MTRFPVTGISISVFAIPLAFLILAPVILLAAFFARKGRRPALFILMGSLMYACYTFAIYCFALHFNALFLVY